MSNRPTYTLNNEALTVNANANGKYTYNGENCCSGVGDPSFVPAVGKEFGGPIRYPVPADFHYDGVFMGHAFEFDKRYPGDFRQAMTFPLRHDANHNALPGEDERIDDWLDKRLEYLGIMPKKDWKYYLGQGLAMIFALFAFCAVAEKYPTATTAYCTLENLDELLNKKKK